MFPFRSVLTNQRAFFGLTDVISSYYIENEDVNHSAVINNFSPKAKYILSNNRRYEVEVVIPQYSLNPRRIIVLVPIACSGDNQSNAISVHFICFFF